VKSLTGCDPHSDQQRFSTAGLETRLRPSTIVIGLGNDLLSDDGVGLYVARRLRAILDPEQYDVIELAVGGMGLVDHLLGYRRAVVVDACRTGRRAPGTLTRHRPADFANSPRLGSYHTMDFATALELARRMGAELPDEIAVFAIEVEDVETIRERCTPQVEAAIEMAATGIARALRSGSGFSTFDSRHPGVDSES